MLRVSLNRLRLGTACCALSLLAGCSSSEIFYWGGYEASVGRMAATPDGVDPSEEIAKLEGTMSALAEQQRQAAPGLHAHMGWLYTRAGDLVSARREFMNERTLYPESAQYMDFLLARLSEGG